MRTNTDLKKIERRAYLSFFQDGLWDILLGVFFVAWGLMITFDFVAFAGVIFIAFYFAVLGLKRKLTYPRAGYIKITQARRQNVRMLILGVVLFGLGLILSVIFSTGNRPEWLSEYFMFIFGAMAAIIVAFLASWWKIRRWYIYALLVFANFAVYQWLEVPLNVSFFIPGAIIILCGLLLLYRFLRKYPMAGLEEPDAIA